MTGYGRGSAECDGREVIIELKSVNHRFLDINVRMQRSLLFLEDDLRKAIGEELSRGHIEASVTYSNAREDAKVVAIDIPLLEQYLKAFDRLKELGIDSTISAELVTRFSDVLSVTQNEDDRDEILRLMRLAAIDACKSILSMRAIEGQQLNDDMLLKLANIEELSSQVNIRTQNTCGEYALKLKQRIAELLGEVPVDEQRLAQEIAIYADRVSIDEELVRLAAHIKNMREYMQSTEPVGRKLEFLIQELNREVNTIGSKSVDTEVAALVVDAKSELEKLREQIQNIE